MNDKKESKEEGRVSLLLKPPGLRCALPLALNLSVEQ